MTDSGGWAISAFANKTVTCKRSLAGLAALVAGLAVEVGGIAVLVLTRTTGTFPMERCEIVFANKTVAQRRPVA